MEKVLKLYTKLYGPMFKSIKSYLRRNSQLSVCCWQAGKLSFEKAGIQLI